jgi:hypothetical protein
MRHEKTHKLPQTCQASEAWQVLYLTRQGFEHCFQASHSPGDSTTPLFCDSLKCLKSCF